jgi:hypothetical protein
MLATNCCEILACGRFSESYRGSRQQAFISPSLDKDNWALTPQAVAIDIVFFFPSLTQASRDKCEGGKNSLPSA